MLSHDIAQEVRIALAEDVGSGDVTARLIPEHTLGHARVVNRESAVLCGAPWFDEVFRQLNRNVRVTWHAADGASIDADKTICELHGPARALLTGERTALNFLQTLSGTATLARRYADAVHGTNCKILDTRKTLPGLRAAQKYAVRTGGCYNHRMGLYDAILIKENHIAAAGSIAKAVAAARRLMGTNFKIEVEAETLEQMKEAIFSGVERILLDNMSLDQLTEAVRVCAGRAQLEASGGVNLDNARAVAQTGVDFISIGALTKNVQAVDLSMRFVFAPTP